MQLAVRIADEDRIAVDSEEMNDTSESLALARFETTVLPHVSSAYNLARWLTRSDTDAQDIVQEAVMRAWRFFSGYRGGDGRSWLLAIVRNCCATWRERNRRDESSLPFDEELHAVDEQAGDPEKLAAIRIGLGRLGSVLEDVGGQ